MYLPQFDEEEKQALTIAIQALEEIQQYRAIGTVEDCKSAYGRGYNQGTIDRAEEVTKAGEHGYAQGRSCRAAEPSPYRSNGRC